LDLSCCVNITDTGLALLSPLGNLQEMKVSGCTQITDDGVASILKHTNIHTLELGSPTLTNASIALVAANLVCLHTLYLDECPKITNVDSLSRVPGLHTLGLIECLGITDVSVTSLSACLTSLQTLDMSFCKTITDVALALMWSLNRLQNLSLPECTSITDIGVVLLATSHTKI
jgi:hypothetical protein